MKYKTLVLLLFLSSSAVYGNGIKPVELKNSGVAVGYSIMSTTLPSVPFLLCAATGDVDGSMGSFLLSVSGIIIGPSVGHFYAGNTSRGLKSTCFRAVSGGAFLLSSGGILSVVNDASFGNVELYITIAIVSGLATVGSVVLDIWTCPSSVEKHNKLIREQSGLYFSPEIDIKDESYGFSLSYRF
jgi:hypothetical protein